MPNPALQPRGNPPVQRPIPRAIPQAPRQGQYPPAGQPGRAQQPHLPQSRQPQSRKKSYRWVWVLVAMFTGLFFTVVGTVAIGLMLVYSGGILPAVSVSNVALGGLSEQEAITRLNSQWDSLILRDGERTWNVKAAALGISLDATATAKNAYAMGRTSGNPLNALFGGAKVSPVVTINRDVASAEMQSIADQVNIPPVDAGVNFQNGQVVATPPQNGRSLDVNATINQFASAIQNGTSNGEINLVMAEIGPAVSDASAIVAQAQALLNNPLDIRVYDPVTGDAVFWSASPSEWVNWLTVASDPNSAIGLSLDADVNAVRDYLNRQANHVLDATRSLDIEQGVNSIVRAIRRGEPATGYVQVLHNERTHVVRSGETITSIAWDYGIPYLYIQQLNGGIESVSAGQTIKIPPADIFLTGDVNPAKRIVVSISNQTVKVYENDQLKWDWVASTGISSSPTWTGVYQIQSHVDNAYAANWNLYMPNFMGVYQPVPGADFTNGFHGFPTRGGGQLLWENSLGTKVTYGCILLSNTNIQLLYDWAEEGVVVEIEA